MLFQFKLKSNNGVCHQGQAFRSLRMESAAVFLAAALAAGSAAAADLFVSASGTWKPDGREGTCYTDLRDAINAAQSGDTVWLQDGYVCDSGLYELNGAPRATGTDGGYVRAKIDNKAIVLRSESGYVDEATGKGATIRGAWHDPANGVIIGTNAVHCLWVVGSSSTEIFGLVFEGGSGGTQPGYGQGGGIYGDGCIVSNCVFRNNSAYAGGAVGGGAFTLYNCVLTNNLAAGTGYGGGAIWGRTSAYDCLIASNRSDATAGGVGAISTSTPQPVLTRCRVVGNYTSREGGGVYYCIATNCIISGNLSRGSGGGSYGSTLVDCEIVGNVCSNTLRSGSAMDGSGGGLCYGSATRCLIAGNSAWAQNVVFSGCGGGVANSDLYNCVVSNNWSLSRGAAVFSAGNPNVCYNTLFVGNRSASNFVYAHGFIIEGMSANTMAANPAKFVNCTIADNECSNYSAINGVALVNSIVWNNAAGSPDANIVATNSCASYLTDAHGPGNIASDPLFANAPAGDYTLTPRSPCRDAAKLFDWMTDASDPRSRDLLGHVRLEGALPDMGCHEYLANYGLLIFVR